VEGERLWPRDWHCPHCNWPVPVCDGVVTLAPDLDGQVVGVDPDNFVKIAAWEAGNFWFVSRNELIAWLISRYLPLARRVVEIGCGTGYVITAIRSTLPDTRIAGCELHRSGLEFARRRHGDHVEFVQLDARALHVEQAFDAVLAFDVLEHIKEEAAVLQQIHAALTPSGIAMLAVPQHPWLWSASDEAARHVRRYRRGELAAKMTAAGFEILFVDSFTSLLLPLMTISRIASRRQRHSAAEREFEISPLVNSILLAVQRGEHALRRVGLRMPFGGSQVVVARKSDQG
jgi:SAM-dependent methyltransferase